MGGQGDQLLPHATKQPEKAAINKVKPPGELGSQIKLKIHKPAAKRFPCELWGKTSSISLNPHPLFCVKSLIYPQLPRAEAAGFSEVKKKMKLGKINFSVTYKY